MSSRAPYMEALERRNPFDALLIYRNPTLNRSTRCQQLQITIISVLLLSKLFMLFSIQSSSELSDYSPHELTVSELLPLSKITHDLLQGSEESSAVRQFSPAPSDISSSHRNPRVCIIVTTFNVIDFVSMAVESAINQTYKNVEIIVVDDNSSDGTLDLILKKYATTPPGPDTTSTTLQVIRLTQNTNGGAGQPSNIGIDSCSMYTDYVMFADGDDYMEIDAVESMLAQAEMTNADIVMANFDFIVRFPNGTVVSGRNYDHLHWNRIPNKVPLNSSTHPHIVRISPVPWRKMYRRDMLVSNDLRFPEGDYFHEDNTFHWRTLKSAARCLKIDRVLFHHRLARKGQTSFTFNTRRRANFMTMDWFRRNTDIAKVAGLFSNFQAIGNELFPETSVADHKNGEIAAMFFEWLKSTAWICKKQKTRQLKIKFSRRLMQVARYWATRSDVALSEDYWQLLNKSVSALRASKQTEIDLSIIIPIANVSGLLENFMNTMYAQLDKPGFVFEVFVIDYGSTDKTAQVLRSFIKEHGETFYFLSTSSSCTAGKAINLAIPLVEGRYVYVLDINHLYDFGALVKAVQYASQNENDVLVMPYITSVLGPNKQILMQGMKENDKKIWSAIRAKSNRTHSSQKEAALGLINYPWKQLTSSKLIFGAEIFFGPTKVYYDIQFHWTSIAASRSLHFYDKGVCVQRKFNSANPGRFIGVKRGDRMSIFASLGMTQRALALNGAFDGGEGKIVVLPQWKSFSIAVLNYARRRVQEELLPDFKRKEAHILSVLGENITRKSDLRKWPYWGERFATFPK